MEGTVQTRLPRISRTCVVLISKKMPMPAYSAEEEKSQPTNSSNQHLKWPQLYCRTILLWRQWSLNSTGHLQKQNQGHFEHKNWDQQLFSTLQHRCETVWNWPICTVNHQQTDDGDCAKSASVVHIEITYNWWLFNRDHNQSRNTTLFCMCWAHSMFSSMAWALWVKAQEISTYQAKCCISAHIHNVFPCHM
jgi:hypothetical protein